MSYLRAESREESFLALQNISNTHCRAVMAMKYEIK